MVISALSQNTQTQTTAQAPERSVANIRQLLLQQGDSFATRLEYRRSRSDGPFTLSNIRRRTNGGYEVTYRCGFWSNPKQTMGELHVNVDAKGVFEGGFYTRGEVPKTLVRALAHGELVGALARQGVQSMGGELSKSDSADLVSVEKCRGDYCVEIHVKHFMSGKLRANIQATVDANGKILDFDGSVMQDGYR